MTFFVFSDSHGSLSEMIALLTEKTPDGIIHLGDVSKDAEDIASIFPHIPLYRVPGNCCGFSSVPPIQELEVEGVRILFSHGHLWSVKQKLDIAVAAGIQANADVVLYGHTHISHCKKIQGLWLVNPGPSTESYAVLEIENGSISCEICPSIN